MPSKRIVEHSQNFIRHPQFVRQLLELSNVGSSDLVVEIGSGTGMITRELVKIANRVIAIERDSRFSEQLLEIKRYKNFQLVIEDFVNWQLPQEDYKVFSNIPFNYTSDIVKKLTSSNNQPTDMYLIMQKEAANRFMGLPYHKNSLISILISIDFNVQILTEIDPASFTPKPSVGIVFVHFNKRSEQLIPLTERQFFRDFVVYGYAQWAPTILDAFSKVFTKRQRSIIAKSQKLEHLKPSDTSREQWIDLFKTFDKYVSEDKKSFIHGQEEKLHNQQSKIEKSYRTRSR